MGEICCSKSTVYLYATCTLQQISRGLEVVVVSYLPYLTVCQVVHCTAVGTLEQSNSKGRTYGESRTAYSIAHRKAILHEIAHRKAILHEITHRKAILHEIVLRICDYVVSVLSFDICTSSF